MPPKFFVDTYDVSLSALGLSLFFLRLVDFVQDPLLGKLAKSTRKYRVVPVCPTGADVKHDNFRIISLKKYKVV